MAKKGATASLLLLSLATPAASQVKVSGYLKDVHQYSRSLFDARPYYLNISRARLSLDAELSAFRSHVDYDHQLAYGSFFRTSEFKIFGYSPPKPWLDMEQTLSTGTLNGWGHGAYRAWVGLETESLVLRAGRQRIAWGTGKIWNPTDVLNPYQPTSVERDERRGVDALYGRLGLGTLGQAELAWAGENRWVDHFLLARGRADVSGWDLSLLGGKVAGSTASLVVGGDFAGTVLEGTFHGEWAYFRPEWRTPYWKAGLGYDYTVPSETAWRWLEDAAFVVEYYRAGNGRTDERSYDFAAVRAGREVSVARNYLGGSVSKDLHPLLKLELHALANADDASTFLAPSIAWNALNDLHLCATLQRFGGKRPTEYGRNPNSVVLSAQYYF